MRPACIVDEARSESDSDLRWDGARVCSSNLGTRRRRIDDQHPDDGKVVASPQLGHSVHIEVHGLRPDRWYWYRFRAGDAVSPTGRTRTMPDIDDEPSQLRFAFASCQNYEQGLYTAYVQMAKDELDLVIHLGDYIYEYPGNDKRVRKHSGPPTAKSRRLKTTDFAICNIAPIPIAWNARSMPMVGHLG